MSILWEGILLGTFTTIIAFFFIVRVRAFLLRAGLIRITGLALVFAAAYYTFFTNQSQFTSDTDVTGLMVLCALMGMISAIMLKIGVYMLSKPKK